MLPLLHHENSLAAVALGGPLAMIVMCLLRLPVTVGKLVPVAPQENPERHSRIFFHPISSEVLHRHHHHKHPCPTHSERKPMEGEGARLLVVSPWSVEEESLEGMMVGIMIGGMQVRGMVGREYGARRKKGLRIRGPGEERIESAEVFVFSCLLWIY
jgi:hypothetical protein